MEGTGTSARLGDLGDADEDDDHRHHHHHDHHIMIITDQIVWCPSRSFSWRKGITSGGKLSLETITGDDSYRGDNDDGLYESDFQ